MEEVLKKLKEFKTENYGKYLENISEKCYNLAVKLLKHLAYEPEAFITYAGTVQFEYQQEGNYMEIEISDNGYSIWSESDLYNSLYGAENDNGVNFQEDEMYEVINFVKMFHMGKPQNPVLFTGAFNPPTIAHYHMIDSAIQNGNFDYVIFALSNQTFLNKKQAKSNDMAYSEQERLEMVLEMTWENKNVLIFGIEKGYTYNVLCDVKEKYQIGNLYFAMGSDKLQEISRWGYHDKLLSEFCFYVLMRGEDTLETVTKKCDDIFSNTHYKIGQDNSEYKDISATMVRKAIQKKDGFSDYEKLVHPNVFQYLMWETL